MGKKSSGITLIEILTVICIISILAALLMPGLQSALDSARSLTCQNNYRNIGMAIHEFANDNSGRFPGYGNKVVGYGKTNWQGILNSTVLMDEAQIPVLGPVKSNMLGCPSTSYVPSLKRSLNMNQDLTYYDYVEVTDRSKWPPGPCHDDSEAVYYLGARMSGAKYPSRLIAVADIDCVGGDWFNSWNSDTGLYYYSSPCFLMPSIYGFNRVGNFSFRHSNGIKCSMLFVDGHVAMVDPELENFQKENIRYKP